MRMLCCLMSAAFFAATVGVAFAAGELYVSPDGSNTPPYDSWETAAHTVPAAIAECDPGDTIYIGPGRYTGFIDITKSVSLIGSGSRETILDGDNATTVIYAHHTNFALRVENVTITGGIADRLGSSRGCAGIEIDGTAVGASADISIRNCEIVDNAGDAIMTVNLWSGDVWFVNNVIARNTGYGISRWMGFYHIYNNTIVYNGGSAYRDNVGPVGTCAIMNNVIAFNTKWGVQTRDNTIIDMRNNVMWANAQGDFIPESPGGIPRYALQVFEDPLFADGAGGDYHPSAESPCIDAGVTLPWMSGTSDLDGGRRVSGPKPDIGAYEIDCGWSGMLIRLR